MRLLLASIIASLSFQAHALSLSEKDRAFIGGAATGYILSKMLRDKSEQEDPCWRGGWDDGSGCGQTYHAPPRHQRNSCPTVTWCSMVYNDPYERTACIKGVHECVADAERIDWHRVDDAYLRGRGR